MATAKSLGINKHDCITTSMGFVGIVIGGANTATPLCEVWGLYHELGSVYANELTKITKAELMDSDYFKKDPHPSSGEAKKVLGNI